MRPSEIYEEAIKRLPADEIAHHASDLYLKVSAESKALVNELENASMLSVFRDAIDGSMWYDLPFCYSKFWENPSENY